MLRAALASRSAVYEQFSSTHTYTRDPTQMKMNYVSMIDEDDNHGDENTMLQATMMMIILITITIIMMMIML